jgi:hypothetical protein
MTTYHKEGTLNLDLLEEKVQNPLSPVDYKMTQINFKTKGIKSPDLVDFHQQVSEMLYQGVLQSSTSEKEMKEIALKIYKQLRQENIATKSNKTRVVDLERKIIPLVQILNIQKCLKI